jgi:hypothetical protein
MLSYASKCPHENER